MMQPSFSVCHYGRPDGDSALKIVQETVFMCLFVLFSAQTGIT